MFVRALAIGWALDQVLTSSQMNLIDSQLADAVDGKGGGQYLLDAGLGFGMADDLGTGGGPETVPHLVVLGGRMTSSIGGRGLSVQGGPGTRPGTGITALGGAEGSIVDAATQGYGVRGEGSDSGPAGIVGGSGVVAIGGDAELPSTVGGAGVTAHGGDNPNGTGGFGIDVAGGTGSDAAHGGTGIRAFGIHSGFGGLFVGGGSGGDGVHGLAVSGNAIGVYGRGWGLGPGVVGEANTGSNGAGVVGIGKGTGPGLNGGGGGAGTTAFGVVGFSANVGSGGVWGIGSDGDNIQGGLVGWGCPSGGDGGYGAKLVGSASRAELRLEPRASDPTIAVNGDLWTDGFDLFVRLGGVTKQVAFV